jgi:hypothetical protein
MLCTYLFEKMSSDSALKPIQRIPAQNIDAVCLD